jgi:hypothetical protein
MSEYIVENGQTVFDDPKALEVLGKKKGSFDS